MRFVITVVMVIWQDLVEDMTFASPKAASQTPILLHTSATLTKPPIQAFARSQTNSLQGATDSK